MIAFLQVLQFLVLGLWVGAMFGFGVLYAPVLFAQLPSRDQAGAIAGATLTRIDAMGLVVGGIMVVATFLQLISAWRALDLLRVLLAVGMLGAVLFSTVSVRQRLDVIRGRMARPVEEFGDTDPLRMEYNKYHRLSRGLFFLNMLLGTCLITLSALR